MTTPAVKVCATCKHWAEPEHKTCAYDPSKPWGRCVRFGADYTPMITPGHHTCITWKSSTSTRTGWTRKT